MQRATRALLIISILLVLAAYGTRVFSGKVVNVVDGDTIKVLDLGRARKIRLRGIDCPEKAQPFFRRAKERAIQLVAGRVLKVKTHTKDRHGRDVGDVFINDQVLLNHMLVKEGLCFWYQRYAREDQALKVLEQFARDRKLGVWSLPKPVPPWEYRESQRRSGSAAIKPRL